MKILTTREQIAKAINFKNDLAVLELDVANTYTLQGEIVGSNGCNVRIDFGNEYYSKAELQYWKDTKRLTITRGPVILTNDFGYSDIKEMLEYRNAPVIKNGCKILLVVYNSKRRIALSPVEFEVDNLSKMSDTVILKEAEWIEQVE